MRDYGKLSPFFWTRGSGKRLRGNPDAQVVAAYLSTAPGANMIGIYYVSLASIASDTGIPDKRVRAALSAIEGAGYAFYDFVDEIAWVPNHAHFEIGPELRPGDKRRPRVYAELNQVRDHRFANDFRERYAFGYGLEPPIARPPEGASKGHPATAANTDDPSLPTPGDPGEGNDLAQVNARLHQKTRSERGMHVSPQDQDQDQDQDQGSIGTASPPAEPATQVRSRRKPETPCPPSEASPETVTAWAEGWKVPVDHPEFYGWLDHHRKSDARWRDWAAAWRTWLKNASRFSARAGGAPRQQLGTAASAPWMNPTTNFDFREAK